MNYELIALAVFVALLTLFLVLKRKKLEIQKIVWPLLYFVLYRTKLGLKAMDKIAKHRRLMKVFAVAGVVVGFVGIFSISGLLIWNLIKMILEPAVASGVSVVLPIKGVKGVFYVPFFYWIISILVIASVHEFSHGMIARFNKIKIKSSGFAFLGLLFPIIPAAFVEPDEKELGKKKLMQKLEVFAAGPFSNIVSGFIFLGIFLLIAPPLVTSMWDFHGMNITDINNKSALIGTNITVGDTILKIDSKNVTLIDQFIEEMDAKKPGQPIILETDKGNYNLTLKEHPDNQTKAYLGVNVEQNRFIKPTVIARFGNFLPNAAMWIMGLIWWLYLLHLGIGLFNLVPAGPIDGGQMVRAVMFKKFKKDKAAKICRWISIFFLLIIVLNVLAGFIF